MDGYTYNNGSTITGWPSGIFQSWWYTVQSAANIYTNLYYDPDYAFGIITTSFGAASASTTMLVAPSYVSGVLSKEATVVAKPSAPLPALGMRWQYSYNCTSGTTTLTGHTNRTVSATAHSVSTAPPGQAEAPEVVKALPPVAVPRVYRSVARNFAPFCLP